MAKAGGLCSPTLILSSASLRCVISLIPTSAL